MDDNNGLIIVWYTDSISTASKRRFELYDPASGVSKNVEMPCAREVDVLLKVIATGDKESHLLSVGYRNISYGNAGTELSDLMMHREGLSDIIDATVTADNKIYGLQKINGTEYRLVRIDPISLKAVSVLEHSIKMQKVEREMEEFYADGTPPLYEKPSIGAYGNILYVYVGRSHLSYHTLDGKLLIKSELRLLRDSRHERLVGMKDKEGEEINVEYRDAATGDILATTIGIGIGMFVYKGQLWMHHSGDNEVFSAHEMEIMQLPNGINHNNIGDFVEVPRPQFEK